MLFSQLQVRKLELRCHIQLVVCLYMRHQTPHLLVFCSCRVSLSCCTPQYLSKTFCNFCLSAADNTTFLPYGKYLVLCPFRCAVQTTDLCLQLSCDPEKQSRTLVTASRALARYNSSRRRSFLSLVSSSRTLVRIAVANFLQYRSLSIPFGCFMHAERKCLCRFRIL